MCMKTSDVGIELIKEFESCSLTAYLDPVNIWTIGWGHTANVQEGQVITQSEADFFLKADLLTAENAVNRYNDTYHWTQNQFDALVSFTYNCGAGNLDNLLDYGRATIEEIENDIQLFNKAGGKTLPGLRRRRFCEWDLFTSDDENLVFYPKYTGKSENLDEILTAIGADADYDKLALWLRRRPIAEANGITNYIGSAEQNIQLKDKAKNGTLRKVGAR